LGQRKYRPLTPGEVVDILTALGFHFDRKEGSHAQYERAKDGVRPRSIVTVDTAEKQFDDFLIKSMIRQSSFSRDEFYRAIKSSARKAGLKNAK
jgi:predicted RNA binding protein YcfA (HicA-like mRNA interferase family)